jgi:hypothetical protein
VRLSVVRWTSWRKPLLLVAVALAALAPPAALAATAALPGTYAKTQNGQRLMLRLTSGGAHTFRVDGDLGARGDYTRASGRRITFRDEAGPLACPRAGMYTWTLRRGKLRFEVVADRCAGRRAALTGGAFTKQ